MPKHVRMRSPNSCSPVDINTDSQISVGGSLPSTSEYSQIFVVFAVAIRERNMARR